MKLSFLYLGVSVVAAAAAVVIVLLSFVAAASPVLADTRTRRLPVRETREKVQTEHDHRACLTSSVSRLRGNAKVKSCVKLPRIGRVWSVCKLAQLQFGSRRSGLFFSSSCISSTPDYSTTARRATGKCRGADFGHGRLEVMYSIVT